jgi:hypothetical protein
MTSIILIGKGPSLLRCNKEFIDKYEDIAIIGYPPPTEDFMKLIKGKKIKYHFCNCGDPYLINNNKNALYDDNVNKELGIEEIWDYASGVNNYKKYLIDKSIFKKNLKNEYLQEFKDKYNFDKWGPSGGIYALHHIIKQDKYDKIGLIGFDNFEVGKKRYYFGIKHYQPSLKYLLNPNGPISLTNITKEKSLHDQEKTINYLSTIFLNKNHIEFKLYTNIAFEQKHNNIKIF